MATKNTIDEPELALSRINHVAFFVNSLASGGAEKVILDLASDFIQKDIKVDLVICKHSGPLSNTNFHKINVIALKKNNRLSLLRRLSQLPAKEWLSIIILLSSNMPKSFSRIISLQNYIEKSKPDVILSSLNTVNITALWAKHLSNSDTSLIIQQVNYLSEALPNGKTVFERFLLPNIIKRWYPKSDKIISVSEAVKKDLVENFSLPEYKITTIYNPLNLAKIKTLSSKNIDEEWLKNKNTPVAIAVGRLNKVKNYPLLIKAIKQASTKLDIKLIIIGDGPEKQNLLNLISDLNMEKFVKLIGYQSNPYAYMKLSDVFILSSESEGLANVLQEAIACDCNIVSTDCPGGPRELLEDGAFGKLVVANNEDALAQAIIEELDRNIDPKKNQTKANSYSLQTISNKYIEEFTTIKLRSK